MVKKKHIYSFVGAVLLVGFSYFVFQFSFSNSVNLIDLKKSSFQPYELPIAKFFKIPDTPYLFAKFTDHYDMETIYGHISSGDQQITLIDLTDNTRMIDRYFKNAFQMSQVSVFLINDEPMIQCHFFLGQSKIRKFIYDMSPFYIKNYLGDPYYRIFLAITEEGTKQIDQDNVHLQSIFALDGEHPFIKGNLGNDKSLNNYQLLEWKNDQWEPMLTFNAPYTFRASVERANHGYTKNTWTVRKQGSLLVHDRDHLENVAELPIDQVYQLVSPSSSNRISSLVYLNEGWNFGQSNLVFDMWKSWSNGAQTGYSLVEFTNEISEDMNIEDVLRVVKPNNKMIPFTSLQNDTVVLLSPDVELAFNCFILSGTSKLYAMTRNPGEEFNSEPIEVDIPDDAVVSKFPIDDQSLLIYRNQAFWSMEWDTGEMTKL